MDNVFNKINSDYHGLEQLANRYHINHGSVLPTFIPAADDIEIDEVGALVLQFREQGVNL